MPKFQKGNPGATRSTAAAASGPRQTDFLPLRVGLSHMASLLMIPPPSQRLLRRDGGGGRSSKNSYAIPLPPALRHSHISTPCSNSLSAALCGGEGGAQCGALGG